MGQIIRSAYREQSVGRMQKYRKCKCILDVFTGETFVGFIKSLMNQWLISVDKKLITGIIFQWHDKM